MSEDLDKVSEVEMRILRNDHAVILEFSAPIKAFAMPVDSVPEFARIMLEAAAAVSGFARKGHSAMIKLMVMLWAG